MQPKKGNPIVEIPVTFDYSAKPQGLTNDKFILAGISFLVWIVISVLFSFTDKSIVIKILFIIGSFVVISLFVRYIILREAYFKKRRNDLVDKNFQYPTSQFWNIYEITNSYPYICRYANGLKSIFVVFDKDVIVGRESDNDYYHFEAIANAYLQMHKRGIDCMHIDYMDTVGKDERINSLFELAGNAQNPHLSEILTRVFDNVNYIMEHSYASYDVYCFFYNGKDELFWDELGVVVDAFLEANYIRCRVLNKEEIGELVKSVFNISNFSVNLASEKLFTDLGGTHYLTPIWVERGEERKILNKTREEKEAEMNVKQAEKGVSKRKLSGYEKKMQKYNEMKEIDLFGDDASDNNMNRMSNISLNKESDNYSSIDIEKDSDMYIDVDTDFDESLNSDSEDELVLKDDFDESLNSDLEDELVLKDDFDEDEEIELF